MKLFLGTGLLAIAGLACLLAAVEAESLADCTPSVPQIPATCIPPQEYPPIHPIGGCVDDGTGSCMEDGCDSSDQIWGILIQGGCAPGIIREGSIDRCQAQAHTQLIAVHAWAPTCAIRQGNCECFWMQLDDETNIPMCVCAELPPLTN